MQRRAILVGRRRSDGLIGNYLVSKSALPVAVQRNEPAPKPTGDDLSEDDVKCFLEKLFVATGWKVQVAWGKKTERRHPGPAGNQSMGD